MAETNEYETQGEPTAQKAARLLLGGTLIFAGVSHLTFARKPFRAQVPRWVPLKVDDVVVYSGVTEISLGTTLIASGFASPETRRVVGMVAGTFFTAIFPGNIAQYRHHRSAFGLDTDNKRFARLFFQPVLVAWALWSTGVLSHRGGKQQD